jgi:hypothetical protein
VHDESRYLGRTSNDRACARKQQAYGPAVARDLVTLLLSLEVGFEREFGLAVSPFGGLADLGVENFYRLHGHLRAILDFSTLLADTVELRGVIRDYPLALGGRHILEIPGDDFS